MSQFTPVDPVEYVYEATKCDEEYEELMNYTVCCYYDYEYDPFYYYGYLYLLPIIAIIGTIGSLLSFFVFTRKQMRLSSSFYCQNPVYLQDFLAKYLFSCFIIA